MPFLTRRTAIRSAAVLPAAFATPAPAATPPGSAAAALAAPVGALGIDRPLFGAVAWTLPNGLRVVLAESRRVPVVTHHLFYAAGGGEDPAGRSGTAHFLEHMMFKGSRNVAPGALSLAVAREGGQDNAFTSRDVTAYHQTVEASRLALVMRLEADRFAGPLLPPDTVEPERAVILEERRLRTDSNPRSRFWEAFEAAMWGPQHWHGQPIIGWEDEIRAITRDDMLAFYGRRYAPENAVLIVTGDVREAECRRLVDDFYGPVPPRAFAARDRAAPPAVPPEPRLVRHDPAVREATFMRAVLAPSLTWPSLVGPSLAGPSLAGLGLAHPADLGSAQQAWALEVLSHLLGGGPGSRLHQALVETGLATTASASYDGEVLGPGTFGVSATPRPGVAPERLEAAVDATLARLLQDGPTEAERARSVRQLTFGAVLALDSVGAAPRMLGGALAIGLPLELVEFWPAHLRAVTLPQLTTAARVVLGGGSAAAQATGWLLPGAAPARASVPSAGAPSSAQPGPQDPPS